MKSMKKKEKRLLITKLNEMNIVCIYRSLKYDIDFMNTRIENLCLVYCQR
jgi:hypothetical protein